MNEKGKVADYYNKNAKLQKVKKSIIIFGAKSAWAQYTIQLLIMFQDKKLIDELKKVGKAMIYYQKLHLQAYKKVS